MKPMTLPEQALTEMANLVPAHIRPALRGYIEEHQPVGGFLTAVLSNNLRESIGRADDINLPMIPSIVTWLYNHAPAACWGSPEHVRDWPGATVRRCGRWRGPK